MKREEKIVRAIEDLFDTCQEIKESGKCAEECPMKHLCLEGTTFIEIADLLHSELVAEFIKVAEG